MVATLVAMEVTAVLPMLATMVSRLLVVAAAAMVLRLLKEDDRLLRVVEELLQLLSRVAAGVLETETNKGNGRSFTLSSQNSRHILYATFCT